MIKELNHIGLSTADMDASKKFYVETLGGTIIRDFRDAENLSRFVYVQLALGVIELIRVAPNAANQGFVHVAYLIDSEKSLEEVYADLAGKGYEFTAAPRAAGSGDGRLAFFQDASGVIFELIQRKENIRIRDLVNPCIAAFRHIAINAAPAAAQKCDAFYTSEMGFVKVSGRVTQEGRKSLYALADDSIELTETTDEAKLSRPLHHICFSVDSCGNMRAYLQENCVDCSELSTCTDGYSSFSAFGPSGELLVFTDRNAEK
jgi:catechol 2,3-dioxygenase-like lactoylglutathione lyase family enzyme